MPAAVILLTPLAVHAVPSGQVIRVLWTGVAFVLVIVVTALVATSSSRRAVAAASCVTVAVACYGLTTGQNPVAPWRAGQVHYPRPNYADVIDTAYGLQRDEYAVVSYLHHIMPPPRRSKVGVVAWVPRRWQGSVSRSTPTQPWIDEIKMATAQYGYAFIGALPALDRRDAARLRNRPPDYLIVLSQSGQEFAAAAATLTREVLHPRLVLGAVLHRGHVVLHVQTLTLAPGHRPSRFCDTARARCRPADLMTILSVTVTPPSARSRRRRGRPSRTGRRSRSRTACSCASRPAPTTSPTT